MLGAPVFRTALFGPWSGNALWTAARAVPSLDLCFADKKDLICASSGRQLVTFARASSGTYVDSAGVLQTAATDVPRFDHNPITGESLGLLVEEQRTNLALYSQAINLANWGTQQATTQTLNAATSPDGNSNATLLVENTQNANRFISQAIGVTNTAHTVSIFAKAKERRRIMFRESSVSGASATFDLQSGTVVGSEGSPITSIQPYGNGWYRCVMTYTPSSTSTRLHSVYLMPDSGTSFATSTYTGDGTSGLFLFGFHVEAGATASSYIPTTTAAATRNADVVQITGTNFSSWYRQDEGTVYAEALTQEYTVTTFPRVFSIDDGGATTSFIALVRGSNVRRWDYSVFAGAGQAVGLNNGISPSAGAVCRGAVIYRANDFTGATQGVLMSADTSGIVPTVNALGIGMQSNAALQFNGHIRRIAFWPQRLDNATLQAITQP